MLAFNRRGFVVRRGSNVVVVAWGRRRRRGIRITSGRRKIERRKEWMRISRMRRRRLRDRASLIILKVFSEEMVGWGLRSSEPCGCTLTLRDRFLWLSVLVRVGAERWGQRKRQRGGRGVPGARCERKMGSLRNARSSCICRGNELEKGENGKKV